jgi:HTH-like domain
VDADLHVWEGMFHGFFYNVDVPESRDCFDVIVKGLMGKIEAIQRRLSGVYGSPNIHAELADDHGIRVGRKRVARLIGRTSGRDAATVCGHDAA